ncbi:hypothetical protein AVEN_163770-1 [Araneus ventricosus]|uniref:Uncharacterized protein n=1 Tax=Araneus ventricosus TaxID=182803 RepID=A0A4Y2HP03_ARAVE|nr:hypothetical protein AVEN_163770-1 [Araneus ventricosus]
MMVTSSRKPSDNLMSRSDENISVCRNSKVEQKSCEQGNHYRRRRKEGTVVKLLKGRQVITVCWITFTFDLFTSFHSSCSTVTVSHKNQKAAFVTLLTIWKFIIITYEGKRCAQERAVTESYVRNPVRKFLLIRFTHSEIK